MADLLSIKEIAKLYGRNYEWLRRLMALDDAPTPVKVGVRVGSGKTAKLYCPLAVSQYLENRTRKKPPPTEAELRELAQPHTPLYVGGKAEGEHLKLSRRFLAAKYARNCDDNRAHATKTKKARVCVNH